MYIISLLLVLTNCAAFVSALPAVANKCVNKVYPTIMQQLNETDIRQVGANLVSSSNQFLASQNAAGVDKIDMVVAFQNIPQGSYGCQLAMTFPDESSLKTVGTASLQVRTLFKNAPQKIRYPNAWSYNRLQNGSDMPITQSVFGEVTPQANITSVINSEGCAENLAFVFEISPQVSISSSVEFTQYINKLNGQGLTGLYLTYNC